MDRKQALENVRDRLCPYCGETEFEFSFNDPEMDAEEVSQAISCNTCGKDWTEIYVIDRIVMTNTEPLEILKIQSPDTRLLEACKLMYQAWEQLLPNLKNGVVQDYELVLTKAPIACKKAIAEAEGGIQ